MICLIRRKLNIKYYVTIMDLLNIYINIMNFIKKMRVFCLWDLSVFHRAYGLCLPRAVWSREGIIVPLTGKETEEQTVTAHPSYSAASVGPVTLGSWSLYLCPF